MSETLARIRVRETHGIRRFLYPLWAELNLPQETDTAQLSLTTSEGTTVPCEVRQSHRTSFTINFAVSLDPLSERTLLLQSGSSPAIVDDPLSVTIGPDQLTTQQRRLATTLGSEGLLREVVYDGVPHLRAPCAVSLNDEHLSVHNSEFSSPQQALFAMATARGVYSESQIGSRFAEVSACKSWVSVGHVHEESHSGDTVTFLLPLALQSDTLLFDFGAGGGVYGKLQVGGAEEVVWRTQLTGGCPADWSVATAGRTDYIGTITSPEDGKSQLWFHVIDSNKSLAVALPHVAATCTDITITINVSGDVVIRFVMGESAFPDVPASFTVCYHFLNDVPAIAAATNPQSILLPPIVEVLPA